MNNEEIANLKKTEDPMKIARMLLSKENYGRLLESRGQKRLLPIMFLLGIVAMSALYLCVYFLNVANAVSNYRTELPNLSVYHTLFYISSVAQFALFFLLEKFHFGRIWNGYVKWFNKSDNQEDLEKIFGTKGDD